MNRKERKLYIPQVIDRLLELLNGDYRAEACTVLTFLISDRIVGQYLPCLDIFWSSLRHLESKQSAMVLRLLTECIPRVTCKKDDHSLKQSLDADIMVHLQMTDGSFSRATMPLLLLLDRSLTCSRTMTDKNFLDLVKFGKAQKVCHIRCLAARILARSPERCQDILEPLDWHSLNELHFKLLVLHYIPSVLSSNAALFSTVSAISASEIPLLSDLCNNLISR